MGEWIELTSRTDRTKVWVNMEGATAVIRESGGSRISLQGREKDLYVAETPEAIMTKRVDANSS